MEYLEFIFQDFWHWAGTLMLITPVCWAVGSWRLVGFSKTLLRQQSGGGSNTVKK